MPLAGRTVPTGFNLHSVCQKRKRASLVEPFRSATIQKCSTSLQLTHGNGEGRPQCSPDGRSVIYEQGIGNVKRTLWKVPIEGGEPATLTGFHTLRPAISPDGKNIAFYFMDKSRANSPWCVGIVSANGGEMTAKFDLPATVISRFVNWTADSKNLAYINDIGGVSNVWLQPLGGEPPRQITNFQSGRILAFDWSRDGKQFFFSSDGIKLCRSRDGAPGVS